MTLQDQYPSHQTSYQFGERVKKFDPFFYWAWIYLEQMAVILIKPTTFDCFAAIFPLLMANVYFLQSYYAHRFISHPNHACVLES